MEKIILFLFTILISSCSSQIYKPEDLIFTKKLYFQKPKALLNNRDIREDIELLIYALQNGYGAKGFLPKNQLKDAIDDLEKIYDKNELTENGFCALVGDALWPVQDGHLNVRARGKYCGLQVERRKWKGSVGKNFAFKEYKKDNRPWHIKSIKRNGLRIGMISIIYYPSHKDSVWNGFIQRSKKLIRTSDILIIDLRGNQGGDDTKGFELAAILQDRIVKPGWDKTIDRLSPETIALARNSWLISKFSHENGKKEVPKYVEDFIQKKTKDLEDVKADKHPPFKTYTWDQSKFPVGKNAYKGKIILLQDKECASSGESSLEALAKHPNATTYGENTMGLYHFGNVNMLILPNSKITIGIASKYNAYNDGRIIDKIGLSPKIKTPKGQDALEFALGNLR
tara:strand:+ start:161248 stop:162441 length:1194 start_codon:yes stop_codon:yes gene_type:complete